MQEKILVIFLLIISLISLGFYFPEKEYILPKKIGLPPEQINIKPIMDVAKDAGIKKFNWNISRPKYYSENIWDECISEMRIIEGPTETGECKSQIIPTRMFKGSYECPHYEQKIEHPFIFDKISSWVPCICPGDKKKKIYIKEINKLRKSGEAKRYAICENVHREIHAQGNGERPGVWTAGISRRRRVIRGL